MGRNTWIALHYSSKMQVVLHFRGVQSSFYLFHESLSSSKFQLLDEKGHTFPQGLLCTALQVIHHSLIVGINLSCHSFLWSRVSLCSPGGSWTHGSPLPSAALASGLQVGASRPSSPAFQIQLAVVFLAQQKVLHIVLQNLSPLCYETWGSL